MLVSRHTYVPFGQAARSTDLSGARPIRRLCIHAFPHPQAPRVAYTISRQALPPPNTPPPPQPPSFHPAHPPIPVRLSGSAKGQPALTHSPTQTITPLRASRRTVHLFGLLTYPKLFPFGDWLSATAVNHKPKTFSLNPQAARQQG